MLFSAHQGLLKEEHTVGAKYEIDDELSFDFPDAANNDNISITVDYGSLYKKVQEALTPEKYILIEAVASHIAHDLPRDFKILEQMSIRGQKLNFPVYGICDYAEANYSTSYL